jgi:hypothetical protein
LKRSFLGKAGIVALSLFFKVLPGSSQEFPAASRESAAASLTPPNPPAKFRLEVPKLGLKRRIQAGSGSVAK